MTVISTIPFLVAVVGAILHCVVQRADVKQLALVAWFCGLLVTLWGLAGHGIRIG